MMAVRLCIRTSVRSASLLGAEPSSTMKLLVANAGVRSLSTYSPKKNFRLMSQDGFTGSKLLKEFKDESKPLVIMLPWLMAQDKYVQKYCDLYLKRGFNVMTVSITPWQFFWPLAGAQVIAAEVLDILERKVQNQKLPPLIVHGFSVGAYLWGEVLVKMNMDLPRYQPLIRQIKGQIWDSPAEITETTKGLPAAIFPKNAFLRSTMEKYVNYHLNSFYDAATQHYLRASQLFHTTPVHAPSLLMVSLNDPIGSAVASNKCKESWESVGMKVYMQCWEKSRHVSHLMLHKEVYLKTFDDFLNECIRKEDGVQQKVQANV